MGFRANKGCLFRAWVPKVEDFANSRFTYSTNMEDLLLVSKSISNKTDLNDLMIKTENSSTPFDEFEITSYYPNPFGESFSIGFNLPGEQSVTISITDLKGSLVYQDVIRGRPGFNLYSWNGYGNGVDPVRPGVYLYTLSGANFKVTNRIVKK